MAEDYPNLVKMCRLCLKENAGTVSIFPTVDEAPHKLSLSSLSVRIMTVVAQEVINSDEMPKLMCKDCRYQLEKSYLFRKRVQLSENKLRNHLRLLSLGKKSRVFDKSEENEYMVEEMEFEESLRFIKEQEEERSALERETLRQELLATIDEEQIRANVRAELREEVREECRNMELDGLLNDLEDFLCQKRLSLRPDIETLQKKRLASSDCNLLKSSKRCKFSKDSISLETSNTRDEGNNIDTEDGDVANEISDDDHANDDDDSKFYLVNTDAEAIDDSKVADAEADTMENENATLYYKEKDKDSLDLSTEKSPTSYQIENFKIQLAQTAIEDNRVPSNDDGVMVFNIEQNAESGQMDMVKLISMQPKVILMRTDSKEESVILNENKTPISDSVECNTKQIISCTAFSKLVDSSETELITEIKEGGENLPGRTTDTLKTFKCTVCPKVFSTKHSLKRHSCAHRKAEEKGFSYQCKECHIFLSCKSALSRHMVIHSGEKPYTCRLCHKSFVQREILTRHMQIHTGDRPHKCPHCERSFSQRVNLTHHISSTHLPGSKVQTHDCHLCPKSFHHASGLSRHLAHHSGVAFQCNACNRQFSDRSSVKRHIQKVHGIDEAEKIAKYIRKAKDIEHLKADHLK